MVLISHVKYFLPSLLNKHSSLYNASLGLFAAHTRPIVVISTPPHCQNINLKQNLQYLSCFLIPTWFIWFDLIFMSRL